MKWIGLFSLAVMATAAGGARAEDVCAKAAALLSGQTCVATPRGAVFSPDPARAAELAGYASAGEQRFQTHFKRPAPLYVVYEITSPEQPRQVSPALLKLGYRPLQWPSKKTQQDLADKSTQVIIARLKANGRPAEMIEQITQRRITGRDAEIAQREASVVPHELSHKWYVESGWPGAIGDVGGHYGGPGPDWMDELSALTAETDTAANHRRQQFKDIYQVARPELSQVSQATLLDLPAFLDQPHPSRTGDMPGGITTSVGAGVNVTLSTGSGGATSPSILFYLKARMVADFLMEKTGDQAVFGSILDSFRQGQSFDDWLRTEGVKKGLAPDRQGLDRQWRDWLKAKLGEPKIA